MADLLVALNLLIALLGIAGWVDRHVAPSSPPAIEQRTLEPAVIEEAETEER